MLHAIELCAVAVCAVSGVLEAGRLAVEWLQVTSTRTSRAGLGLDPRARERQLQASLRLSFD